MQTTVSRDIADLGLVKVRAPSGRLVYAPPGSTDGDRMRALAAAMRRYALTVEAAGTLVVVTTPSGYANALAQAMDEAAHPVDRRDDRRRQHDLRRGARRRFDARTLRDELAGDLLQGAA